MARKGGGGTEIYYRSGTASRLPIFTDGSVISGACGGRMDNPLMYINPESYRSIKIIKGPQDIRYGSLVNGAVVFDKEFLRLSDTTMSANLNALVGSNSRFETSLNLLGGNEYGSLQILGGKYKSKDYKDGKGRKVHSEYDKESVSFIGTLTPTETTAIRLSGDFGWAEAAYADRMMDGVKFDRISWGLDLEQLIGEHKLTINTFYHDIDHVMDNFSLRGTPKMFSINHPKREIYGAKIEGELNFDTLTTYPGMSYSKDTHELRVSGKQKTASLAQSIENSKPFKKTREFEYTSFYIQGENIEDSYGLFGGLRLDHVKTTGFPPYGTIKQTSRTQNPVSGFFRYEHYIDNLTLYAGLGHAQRVADHWESFKPNGLNLKKEKNTQFDFGAALKGANYEVSANLFASRVDDYIMIDYRNPAKQFAFNTDIMMLGGEVEGEILLKDILRLGVGVSYVYGKNLKNTNGLKDGDALPLISPLTFKAKVGLEQPNWFIMADFYANAAQTRYQERFGNAVGMDYGKTASFWTVDLSAGYKYKNYQFIVAAENLNDKLYSYHTSKSNLGSIPGYDFVPTERVYEPGRSFWFKFKAHF